MSLRGFYNTSTLNNNKDEANDSDIHFSMHN